MRDYTDAMAEVCECLANEKEAFYEADMEAMYIASMEWDELVKEMTNVR